MTAILSAYFVGVAILAGASIFASILRYAPHFRELHCQINLPPETREVRVIYRNAKLTQSHIKLRVRRIRAAKRHSRRIGQARPLPHAA